MAVYWPGSWFAMAVLGCRSLVLVIIKPSKVSAGNSGHRRTPDTLYVSAMDKPFGLKYLVLKRLPLGYIQTKNELKAQRHWAANLRFVLNVCF